MKTYKSEMRERQDNDDAILGSVVGLSKLTGYIPPPSLLPLLNSQVTSHPLPLLNSQVTSHPLPLLNSQVTSHPLPLLNSQVTSHPLPLLNSQVTSHPLPSFLF